MIRAFPVPVRVLLHGLLFALAPGLALAQGTITCEPGVSGVVACPCANPPSGPARGCDNSLATGGGHLTATGIASLGADSVQLNASFLGSLGPTCANPSGNVLSVLYEGTSSVASAVWGDGVLCCGGTFFVLATGQSNGGMFHYPLPGTTGLSATAIAAGDPLVSGSTRCYFVAYRDACPTFCTPSLRQKTNSYQITWGP